MQIVVNIDPKLARWLKWGLLCGGVPAFLLGAALVHASVTVPTFMPQEHLSAATMNAKFKLLQDAANDLDTRLQAAEATLQSAGRFCGATSGMHSANLRAEKGGTSGYVAAAMICQSDAGAACAKSHLCTANEVSLSAQNGLTIPAGWFSSMIYGYTTSPDSSLRDCLGWTTSDAAQQASYWAGATVSIANCNNVSFPLLCCR